MTDPTQPVSRRRLLRLVGGAGVVAAASACGAGNHQDGADESAAVPTTPVAAPVSAGVPAPAAPPAPGGTTAKVLCRDAWGAAPARPGGTRHTPNRLTVHHSGVVLGDNRNVVGRFRQHQHYHQDQHGWIDIAYHFGVDRRGNLFELRNPLIAGDTATSYDTTGHFLVLCEGDFDQESVTEGQLDGAALIFAWAAQFFHIESSTLAGHRDADPSTGCPGSGLYGHVTSGDLRARIDRVLGAGTVSMELMCGPEANAVVADIEAGR